MSTRGLVLVACFALCTSRTNAEMMFTSDFLRACQSNSVFCVAYVAGFINAWAWHNTASGKCVVSEPSNDRDLNGKELAEVVLMALQTHQEWQMVDKDMAIMAALHAIAPCPGPNG